VNSENLINLSIEKKALVIGFSHPFNAVKMEANSVAAALSLNGFDVTIAIVGEHEFLRNMEVVNDKKLELVFCLGSPSLDILINGKRIWDFLGENVRIIGVSID
jgi:hypothetical protein